jgi:hypothetical protein
LLGAGLVFHRAHAQTVRAAAAHTRVRSQPLTPRSPREEPAAATEDEADVFEVKSILRSKKVSDCSARARPRWRPRRREPTRAAAAPQVRGKDFFLVEWAGYPREMATWEAASNIIGERRALRCSAFCVRSPRAEGRAPAQTRA